MALVACPLFGSWLAPHALRTLAFVALVAAAMLAVDLFVHRVDRSATTGLAGEPLRRLDWRRIRDKLLGFWVTIGILAAAYVILGEYNKAAYRVFLDAGIYVLPAVVVMSPLYVAYVDRRQYDPNDSYAQLGAKLLGRPADSAVLALHARGWLVKGFFVPLMFVYVSENLTALWVSPTLPAADFEHIVRWAVERLFFVDVLLALVAYTLTLRVIDNHMRSVEPTVGGWAVCLACYPPFNAVLGVYTPYDTDGLEWEALLSGHPWLGMPWGSAILLLTLVYVASTVVFGLRFSNLTNRGIVTSGPYRWVKHPAYLSKNLSWWLIAVPFASAGGWMPALQSCLLLGLVNLVYFARARTEERHLMADPAYRAYATFIAERGLFALLMRHGHRIRAAFHRRSPRSRPLTAELEAPCTGVPK